ncbi:MAG: tail fiber domain-containing protein, partial [Bacteroidales bacterium]
YSFAMGYQTVANKDYSSALGEKTTASGNCSVATGYMTHANGDMSTAMGEYTTASGYYTIATGYMTHANGDMSTAMGEQTIANGKSSTAMGEATTASGDYSTAMGFGTTASGTYSTALGNNVKAPSGYETAIGWLNANYTPVSSTGWDPSDRLFVIGNGGGNAMTVLKNGKVGIGTTSPSQILDVNGNARFRVVGSDTYSATLAITSDGTLTTSTSDISMKKDIVPISQALQKVLKMNGVYFSWKNDNLNNRRVGFIAQEMEKVLPEVVFTNPVDGLKGINYPEITAVLAEAVKEQQQQIESTKQENQKLKSELIELKTLVNNLIANQTAQVNK